VFQLVILFFSHPLLPFLLLGASFPHLIGKEALLVAHFPKTEWQFADPKTF
jgi:hypothetical protein